jgi:hypothetical protein
MHAKFMLGFDAFPCTQRLAAHGRHPGPSGSSEPAWSDGFTTLGTSSGERSRPRRELGAPRARRTTAIAGPGSSRRLHEMNGRSAVGVALVQGGFYVLTGVWALVDLDSFMAITGPKTDLWLVKTVGALVTVIGGVLLIAGRRRRVTRDVLLLGIGAAFSLATIDVVYVSAGRISKIYLLDAVAEAGLCVAWALAKRRR